MTSRCLDIDSIPREPIKLLESPSVTRHVPDATRVRSMAHCATRERTRANESVAVASRRVVCSSCLRSCARTRCWGTTSATIGGDDDDDDDSIRFVRRRDDARARERWRTGVRTTGRELGRRLQFAVVVIRKVLVADAVATRRVAGEDVFV